MIEQGKIGVGILTYKRPEYYSQVLNAIPKHKIDYLTIVNDGDKSYVNEKDGDTVILNKKQLGVSKSKNLILKSLIEIGKCEHLFIMEDDMIIKDKNVFSEYIKAANSTGIHHLCYEKCANNAENLKYSYELSNGVKIGFYTNPQAPFMYINAKLIEKLGYFDEKYMNAFEHIDFAYNLIKNKVAPPFWYFPDLLESENYIEPIKGSDENSSITNKQSYRENWNNSAEYFVEKWGHFTNAIPDAGKINLINSLVFLESRYSRKPLINKDHKLSIIIPYRNRQVAYRQIIPSLKKYIPRQIENFEIIIVEQNDNEPFNKGLLNNIGFTLAEGDYVCFHDVDLLPEIADYSYPIAPTHMSSHCSQFNYINIPDKIMGGVILFTKEDLLKVNGYSNEFNGWGKEDDDLYSRCEREGLKPYKHPFGKYYSVPHEHRLNSAIENELHLKNGSRFRDYNEGRLPKDYHKTDGISNVSSLVKNILIENIENNIKKALITIK
jgi:hypothetical protein